MSIGDLLNTDVEVKSNNNVPYLKVTDETEFTFRMTHELNDSHTEIVHFVQNIPGVAKGFYLCNKQLKAFVNEKGEKIKYLAGDCVLCTEGYRQADLKLHYSKQTVSGRQFRGYAGIEQRIEKDGKYTYEQKVWTFNTSDLYLKDPKKKVFKTLSVIAKNAEGGSIQNTWILLNGKDSMIPGGPVDAKDKKRKIEPLDITAAYARPYEVAANVVAGLVKANAEVTSYDDVKSEKPTNAKKSEAEKLEDEFDDI